jgi:hypothetical protein
MDYKEALMASLSYQVNEQDRIALIHTFKHFHPGAKVDLQFNAENPFRVRGKLIGFDEGRYIILSLSPHIIRDYTDVIKEGNGCVIRTLVEGEAGKCVAFRSTVSLITPRPKGLLFIQFPKSVESISLRKESRMVTQLPVVIVHRDDTSEEALFDAKTELTGHIRDISRGGCRVSVQWGEGQGKIQNVPIYLKVNNVGQEESIIVKAVIKNQQREDPISVSLGMMFETNNKLNDLITELGL